MSLNSNGTGLPPAYNDNSIPFGGIGVSTPVTFFRGQVAPISLGIYLVEMAGTSRVTKGPERPDQLGGPNGFALVRAQGKGSAKIQLAIAATPFLQEGDWFQYTFDATIGVEKYVIEQITMTFEQSSYWFQQTELKRAYFN